ncbi:MAG: hypothetical protein AAF334_06955 [Pseudomonadota bacterium]
MTRSSAVSIRHQLRSLTTGLHAKVEAKFWSPSGFADLAAYRHFLGLMREAHGKMGLPAAEIRCDEDDMRAERDALDHLSADLAIATEHGTHPDMDVDFSWGVGYALTGSALGASLILRSETLRPDWPVDYLSFMQSRAKRNHVRRFFDALERAGPDPEAASRGAYAVFDVLDSGFSAH